VSVDFLYPVIQVIELFVFIHVRPLLRHGASGFFGALFFLQVSLHILDHRTHRADSASKLLAGDMKLLFPAIKLPLFMNVDPDTIGFAALVEIVCHVAVSCARALTDPSTPKAQESNPPPVRWHAHALPRSACYPGMPQRRAQSCQPPVCGHWADTSETRP
jgi:hypothetical protein